MHCKRAHLTSTADLLSPPLRPNGTGTCDMSQSRNDAATNAATLQHTAAHCNTLSRTDAATNAAMRDAARWEDLAGESLAPTPHCDTLEHVAPHCNTLHPTLAPAAMHCLTNAQHEGDKLQDVDTRQIDTRQVDTLHTENKGETRRDIESENGKHEGETVRDVDTSRDADTPDVDTLHAQNNAQTRLPQHTKKEMEETETEEGGVWQEKRGGGMTAEGARDTALAQRTGAFKILVAPSLISNASASVSAHTLSTHTLSPAHTAADGARSGNKHTITHNIPLTNTTAASIHITTATTTTMTGSPRKGKQMIHETQMSHDTQMSHESQRCHNTLEGNDTKTPRLKDVSHGAPSTSHVLNAMRTVMLSPRKMEPHESLNVKLLNLNRI